MTVRSVIDEPLRGRYIYFEQPGLLGLTGLEQMRLFIQGKLPPGPVYHLSGLWPAEVGVGSSTWSMPASPWWRSGGGMFLGGTLAFVADATLGGSIFTTLGPGMTVMTSELSMNFVRPADSTSGAVNGRGRVIQVGRSQGISEALIEDGRSRLLAHATTRCVIVRLPFDPPEPPDEWPAVEQPAYDTPDPFLREPVGDVLPDETWDMNGLEVARGCFAGEYPMPPLLHLTGMRGVRADEGSVEWCMPASEWFCTAARGFYGGVLALFADCVLLSATDTTVGAGKVPVPLDLKVNFLRPVEPDGRPLRAVGTVAHRGRTIALANVEIVNADGKRVAVASSSSMIVPSDRWRPSSSIAPIDVEDPPAPE